MRAADGRQTFARLRSAAPSGKSASSSSRRSRRARAKRRQQAGVLRVEIVFRHRRESLPLAAQEAPDVAAVLAEQARRVIFRMALEKHEQAPALLREAVDARARRARQDVVAAQRELAFAQSVPARMRDRDAGRDTLHQRMLADPVAVEDAEAFVGE